MRWGTDSSMEFGNSLVLSNNTLLSAFIDLKVVGFTGIGSSNMLINLLTASLFGAKTALQQIHSSLKKLPFDLGESIVNEQVEVFMEP